MSDEVTRRILELTRPARPPLCPELRLFLLPEGSPLWRASEAEAEAAGLPAPYWAFAWPGGAALARYLLDHPEVVRGRAVLDFGAGGGICALAALLAGARSVLAADVDPLAQQALRLNARLNLPGPGLDAVPGATPERNRPADLAGVTGSRALGTEPHERSRGDDLVATTRSHALGTEPHERSRGDDLAATTRSHAPGTEPHERSRGEYLAGAPRSHALGTEPHERSRGGHLAGAPRSHALGTEPRAHDERSGPPPTRPEQPVDRGPPTRPCARGERAGGTARSLPLLQVTGEDLVGTLDGDWEVILAGDVCYDPSFATRVMEWLSRLAAQGRYVLLGDPGRVPLPTASLLPLERYLAPFDGSPGGVPWLTQVSQVLPPRHP